MDLPAINTGTIVSQIGTMSGQTVSLLNSTGTLLGILAVMLL